MVVFCLYKLDHLLGDAQRASKIASMLSDAYKTPVDVTAKVQEMIWLFRSSVNNKSVVASNVGMTESEDDQAEEEKTCKSLELSPR